MLDYLVSRGLVAPRDPPAAGDGAGGGVAAARAPRPVESFSWSDEDAAARVYVAFEGAAAALGEADVALETTARSFTLTIRPPGAAHELVLRRDRLYGEVAGGRVRRLKDRVLAILTKAEPAGAWHELQESSLAGLDD